MENFDKDTLVENIKNACAAKGVSVNRALIESGAGPDLVQNISNGKDPGISKIIRLSAYLETSLNALLGIEQKEKPVAKSGELGPKGKTILQKLIKIEELDRNAFELAVDQLDVTIKHQEKKDN